MPGAVLSTGAARAAGEYQQLGASWWLCRLPPAVREHRATVVRGSTRPEQPQPAVTRRGAAQPGVVHLRPGIEGIWWVGRDGAVTAIRDVRGLHYLRIMLQRPGADIADA